MIDRHQSALDESQKLKSPCHIPTVASYPTDEKSLSTRRAVHRLPPSTHPNSLDYGLQVHLQTRSIAASKCISKLTQSLPPSASRNSLNRGLQVHLQTRLITASKFTRSWPPSADLQTRSIVASKCISKLARSRPPSASPISLDHGLQVHL